jgi:hypothetical protein
MRPGVHALEGDRVDRHVVPGAVIRVVTPGGSRKMWKTELSP